MARISRELVRLREDAPVDDGLDTLALNPPDGGPKLIAFLKAMEFSSLTRRVAEATGAEAGEIEPAQLEVHSGADAHGPDLTVPASGLGEPGAEGEIAPAGEPRGERRADAADAGRPARPGRHDRPDRPHGLCHHHRHGHAGELDRRGARGRRGRVRHRDTSLDPMQAELCGFSLVTAPGRAAYVPLAHKSGDGDLLGGGLVEGLDTGRRGAFGAEAAAGRQERAEGRPQQNTISSSCSGGASTSRPMDDTLLISYVTDAGTGGQSMDALSERWLGHTPIAFKDVCGSGRSAITFDMVDFEKATAYAAEDADVTLRLWRVLKTAPDRQGAGLRL